MQAMDGFLIVLDKEANILYVSETITGYVGLSQVNTIHVYTCNIRLLFCGYEVIMT